MPELTKAPSGPRLRFIDMTRAVAILLMLEGHFVQITLAPEWHLHGHPLYEKWLHVRGFAAPMFYMVTGMIFAFLISGAATDEPFFKVRRVRRGLLRVAELFFWGYLLQFQPYLLTGDHGIKPDSWLITCHVLQSIAIGLLIMIATFGVLRRARPEVHIAVFALYGFAMFLIGVLLANQDGYWPSQAPAIIQNIVKGPTSHFPVAPWLGFTFYGAAIGVLVRHIQHGKPEVMNPLGFLAAGAFLCYYGWPIDRALGTHFLNWLDFGVNNRAQLDFFHARFGESLLILGLVICVDKWVKINTSWLQTIGRNTFPIYIIHVIVLYGGIFGIGLNNAFENALNPWQAIIGAVVFCAVFALLAQAIDPLKQRWITWRESRAAFL